MINLMPQGVEHEIPKIVFCCAVNIATLDAARRFHRLLFFRRTLITVFGVSIIDKTKILSYLGINRFQGGLSVGNNDFISLLLRAQKLQKVAQEIQEQADSLEAEVRLKIRGLLSERNELRWRVDPFSENADSLADKDF